MFYETMEEVLPDLKVIIDNGNGTTQTVILDSLGELSSKTQTNIKEKEEGNE